MLLTGGLVSCTPEIIEEKPPELYWPFPPEKPKIKFIDIIRGSLDLGGIKKQGFKETLFGEEANIEFMKPIGVAVKKDIMFVTDVDMVQVYNFGNKKFGIIGRGHLRQATGIAVSGDGRIFVGDSLAKRISVFNFIGTRVYNIGGPSTFEVPGEMALDEINKRLIVPDSKKHVVMVFDLDGNLLFNIGERGSEAGQFNIPYACTVDKAGRIYVLDSGNFRVQIFEKDGKFVKAFGGVGTGPGKFARPKGISLDSEGHIYVVDAAFGNFQIFDFDGNILLAVGQPGTEAGQFSLPFGISIDENDKIYVVDQLNRRVQIFKYLQDK